MEPISSPGQSTTVLDRINHWLRTSTMLKLLVVGFMILLLLIPTGLLQSLISEREATRNGAIAEVSSKWGGEQVIGGPVLSIPYEQVSRDTTGQLQRQTEYAHFLPEDLEFDGALHPEQRSRGIFDVMLYSTQVTIRGSFKKPSGTALGLTSDRLQWNKAFISVGITDMKGIRKAITFRVNNKPMEVEPGIPSNDVLASGVSVPIVPDAETLRFESVITLNGSTQLSFLPFGKETRVRLQSSWPTPSFTGSFLPEQRSVGPQGFQASWKVLQFNRNFPQQGTGRFLSKVDKDMPTFGVKLLLPVDEYQKTMRSAKYSVMFIMLTFVAFFFVEILDRRRIHPIQYLLVGFAICLFYLLLLAISEHLSFDWAYLIGSSVILLLITFYIRYVFKSLRLTALFSGVLALLYGFFYSLLQLEDYSLLLGSLGLLLILGSIMYLTRHVDWYRVYEPKSTQA